MSQKLIYDNEYGARPQRLRSELQHGDSPDLWRRRAIIGLSLVGMTAMAAVSLLQTGIVKHLPDPPLDGFDSDKVNASDTAYMLGVPDGTLSLAGLAANVPLAAFGGVDRARETPMVPLVAAGKAAIEAAVAGWYFYQMPTKEKAWCGYCIVGALANVGIFALTLPEARKAIIELRGK
ncbi:MAG: vitamin K epoxide reductase family protein [Pyrinomonadaceae bacterium MAG19_C2-C3]|nr:vitamin K epoxide reductase family protein [Pyrinomonadaceae bacterium MAG19_C2-C3]